MDSVPQGYAATHKHYWKMPRYSNGLDGGDLLLGPIQFNWYNHGFRIHVTWPFSHTFEIWTRRG